MPGWAQQAGTPLQYWVVWQVLQLTCACLQACLRSLHTTTCRVAAQCALKQRALWCLPPAGVVEELIDCSGGDDISLETGTARKLEALMTALDRNR